MKPVTDTQGHPVVPLNVASKSMKDDEGNLVCNWPLELKPRFADVSKDCCVLSHVAKLAGEEAFAFADDMASYFHQFVLSPSELWKVCVVYAPLKPSHRTVTYVAELDKI